MQRLTTICSTVALTMLYAASGAAHAGDNYGPSVIGIAGSMCQPSHGDQRGDFDINPNGLRNLTTSNRYISCAMVANNLSGIDQTDFDTSTQDGAFKFFVYLDYSQVPAASITTTPPARSLPGTWGMDRNPPSLSSSARSEPILQSPQASRRPVSTGVRPIFMAHFPLTAACHPKSN